jgi:RHS repeat-associated protein
MTHDGTGAYTWDRANRLLSHGGSSYAYNGLGQRVSQTVGAIVTQYLQDTQPGLFKVIKSDNGTVVNRFVHDQTGIHSHESSTGAWNWMLKDGLGSVRDIRDSAGNSAYSTHYTPYGESFSPSGTNPTDYGYTGEWEDQNDLVYLRARYYDPGLGSFVSLDPLETPNRYGYVGGNPVNRVDPSGLQEISPYDDCLTRCLQSNMAPYECEVTCEATKTYEDITKDLDYENPFIPNIRPTIQALIDGLNITPPDQKMACLASLPDIGSLYLEGFNIGGTGLFGILPLGMVAGSEVVYNFRSMERAEFTYQGILGAFGLVGGGEYYVGLGLGFKGSTEGSIISEYSGWFVGSEYSQTVGLEFEIVSAGIGLSIGRASSLPGSDPYIQAYYVGLTASYGLKIPVPIVNDFTAALTYYTAKGNSHSYRKDDGYIDKAALIHDIMVGKDTPLQGVGDMFGGRSLVANLAGAWADYLNAQLDCEKSCLIKQ